MHLQSYNHLKYRGYYHDGETGFYYLNSRYYDPVIGRFITADDAEIVLYDSLSVCNKNLYAYCDNNPANRIDIDGYMWELVLAGGGSMVSGYGISMSAILAAISSAAPVILAVVATVAAVAVVYNGIEYAKTRIDSDDRETEDVKAKKPKKPKKPSKKSGKEMASDVPDWVRYENYDSSLSAAVNARRILDSKYGRVHWPVGPNSEYSKIIKWLQRSRGYK